MYILWKSTCQTYSSCKLTHRCLSMVIRLRLICRCQTTQVCSLSVAEQFWESAHRYFSRAASMPLNPCLLSLSRLFLASHREDDDIVNKDPTELCFHTPSITGCFSVFQCSHVFKNVLDRKEFTSLYLSWIVWYLQVASGVWVRLISRLRGRVRCCIQSGMCEVFG